MPIRTGIIGTGFGATVHAPVLKAHLAYDLVSISSMRPGRAKQAATAHCIPQAYDDWRQMLNENDLDLIVIATKPGFHCEMLEHALVTSHHVLCEKPPALCVSEVKRMSESAREASMVASVNFEWRYLPERRAVDRILDEGPLGDVLHVNWSEIWPLWPHIRDSEASWDWFQEEGGGMLGAIGSHIIDALCHWFGPFATVQGHTVNHVPKRKSGQDWVHTTAEDSFTFMGQFMNGATCCVSCTVSAVGRPPLVEIVGTKGTVRIEGHDLMLATTPSKRFEPVELEPLMDASTFPKEIQGYVHAQWNLYDDLARAIVGADGSNLPTMEDALRVQGE
ncbi:Gfo/Idh/MocA family protein [Alicyclobacillus sp. ALC3]|uniref:Gfo/Idh/MocA family protein n=1 Tax=Alicyclobacillus sp. ALC3 TaxID=2796143 RepID=UPI0023785E45|nr:Gfo/Idh/MocA family oxidoreductase [Alicyclobacillus sp. ALC3]WDL96681.1 Gfo/Idh/MocA family oxidoreductase [Alicyclobacillus sp. ALC3]